jgi:PLD-like domain
MDTEKLYAWMIDIIENDGVIDEQFLRSKITDEDLEHILFLLNYLVSKEYVKAEVVGSNTKYFSRNIAGIRKMLDNFSTPSSFQLNKKLEESLVISIPLSLTENFELLKKKYNIPVIHLKDAIKLLFILATKEVLITSPYIELDGIMYIVDEVIKAAKSGVSLRIITRDIINSKSDSYSYVNKLKAISKLCTLFESNRSSPDAKISIRDFGSQISGIGRTSMHYEGIHQKMIVIDRKFAYIGSGEIRAASFVTNGEAGYVTTGIHAAFWADFFELFWKEAQDVSTSYLK